MSNVNSTIPVGFRQIPGFLRYCIAENGTVLSICSRGSNRVLPWNEAHRLVYKTMREYHYVVIFGQCGPRRVGIHTLVLETFVGPRPDRHECRHLDGNPSNNHVTNLAWGTKVENAGDRIVHGTSNQGERNGHARLTKHDVLQIRQRATNGERYRALAEDFHVCLGYIKHIVNRRKWKHI